MKSGSSLAVRSTHVGSSVEKSPCNILVPTLQRYEKGRRDWRGGMVKRQARVTHCSCLVQGGPPIRILQIRVSTPEQEIVHSSGMAVLGRLHQRRASKRIYKANLMANIGEYDGICSTDAEEAARTAFVHNVAPFSLSRSDKVRDGIVFSKRGCTREECAVRRHYAFCR